MELVGVLFEVLFEIAWWLGVALIDGMSNRAKILRENLETVARALGGKVEKKWFERPFVRFQAGSVSATLRYGDKRDPGGAQADLLFDWRAPCLLRVAPETAYHRVRKWFGAQDIQVNDPAFDARFLIQGTSEPDVRAALDDATRRAIVRVADMALEGDFHVDLGAQGVSVHVSRGIVEDPGSLTAFATAACEVLSALQGAIVPGVRFLPEGTVDLAGRCPVCAQPAEGAVRRCMRCRTPHHEECWEYFGRCGMYACGSVHGAHRKGKSGVLRAKEDQGRVPA